MADVSKPLQLTTKQSRWINSLQARGKMCIFDFGGGNCPFKYELQGLRAPTLKCKHYMSRAIPFCIISVCPLPNESSWRNKRESVSFNIHLVMCTHWEVLHFTCVFYANVLFLKENLEQVIINQEQRVKISLKNCIKQRFTSKQKQNKNMLHCCCTIFSSDTDNN